MCLARCSLVVVCWLMFSLLFVDYVLLIGVCLLFFFCVVGCLFVVCSCSRLFALLSVACCSFVDVRCSLVVDCFRLFVVCCVLSVSFFFLLLFLCVWRVVCCLLFVGVCLLVARYLVCVVLFCILLVVCCLLLVC